MRLKSSNNFPIGFLAAILILAAVLWNFQSNSQKVDKYPDTPMTKQETTLDLIQITVNEKAFNKLKKKRDKAVSVGILEAEDSDFVPATIAFNGKEFPAEIRLKGDWTVHLEGDKWSFRVKLKNDQTIMGMRKFSLHHPGTRRYLNEWLYHRSMKDEGLMGLRYNFVEGKIHVKLGNKQFLTKDVGIYAIEETFDKRTIESNKRKESVILKFSEDYWWNEVKKSKEIADAYGLNYNQFMNYDIISDAKFPIVAFGESKVMADSVMHNYFKFSKNLLEDLRNNRIMVSDAFDVEKLAMDTALMNLFGAVHGTYAINVRYYYNPITSKLEPISFDGNSGVKLTEFRDFAYNGKNRDTAYFKALARALNVVARPQYVDGLLERYKGDIENLSEVLKTEYKLKHLNEENLRFNQGIMLKELETLKQEFNLTDLGEIELAELPPDNAETIDLSNISNWAPRDMDWLTNGPTRNGQLSRKLERTTESSSGFVRYGGLNIDYGNTVEVSVLVRKSENSGVFGLRVQSIYPNRADGLFDLSKGEVLGSSNQGSYSSSEAMIESVGNGWYLCTLKTVPNDNRVNIIFGPSGLSKKSGNWEGPIKGKSSVYILPTSLTLKKY